MRNARALWLRAHLTDGAALVDTEPLVHTRGVLGVLAREHAQLVVLLELLLADRALRERASTRQQQSEGAPMWAGASAHTLVPMFTLESQHLKVTVGSAPMDSSLAPRLTVPTVSVRFISCSYE